MEFWLSGGDAPTPGETPSPIKDLSAMRVDTPPGPPTPEKRVTIVSEDEDNDEDASHADQVRTAHLYLYPAV